VKKPILSAALCFAGVPLLLIGSPIFARGQVNPTTFQPAAASGVLHDSAVAESSSAARLERIAYPDAPGGDVAAAAALPPEPPGPAAAVHEYPGTPTDVTEDWTPFSRIGFGTDLSLLGFGVKSAAVLTEVFDARLEAGFYSYSNGESHINGVNVDAHVRLASMAAKVDWYPMNSVFRLSPGIMLFNGNDLSSDLSVDSGTSFSVNGITYFSAKPNAATGATPFTGKVDVGLHSITPAFTLSGGFGRYIPRSHRHWSFPFEIGAIFTGAPSLNVTVGGWVCKDYKQTLCSDLSDQSNPVAISFNRNLQTALTKYRHDLSVVQVYPILSYGVMYSFNTPW